MLARIEIYKVVNEYIGVSVEFFPQEQRKKKKELYEEITKIIRRLEGAAPISPPILTITSEVVERAIMASEGEERERLRDLFERLTED
ncbi:MAG: hypothetical protein JSV96_17925 [Candidatus Aminicenantes bacterium]|nr:MAG: hypothetical protein JSV96_17925 [Candidatus Aminicenantes bacterium]